MRAAPASRLLMVSNRLPFRAEPALDRGGAPRLVPSAGGLVRALDPVLRRHGGIWFGFCGGVLIFGYGLIDDTVFDRAIALLRGDAAGAPALLADRIDAATTLLQGALQGPAAATWVIALLTWFVTAVWAVVAWGSFRRAYGASRWHAAGATLLWLAQIGVLVAVCIAIAT